MPEEYVCTLSEKSLKKAKKELNEDPKERMGAVETFRSWIESQKHIKCPTDTMFLLAFLRVSKFSQLKARKRLENYLQIFTKYPKWTRNIDTHDEAMKEFFKCGYMVPTGRDDDGRYVCIAKTSNIDIHSKVYNKDDVMRAMVASTFLTMFDEEQQVNGQVYVEDTSDFSIKHQTYFGIDDSKKSMQLWQDAFPQRFKGFHFYNVGPIMEGLFQLIKPVLSKKWVDRFHFHTNLESLYKFVPKKCFPVEYLPDDHKGPTKSFQAYADEFYNDMTDQKLRDLILHYTNPDIFGINMADKDKSEPQASFRKLNVD